MTPILAFDIETVPDVAGLRLLRDLDPKLSDRDVAEHAFQQRRAQTGQDFLPLHLHRVVAIACALREGDSSPSPSAAEPSDQQRSEEHTSELQSRPHLVCRLLLEKKKNFYSLSASGSNGRV